MNTKVLSRVERNKTMKKKSVTDPIANEVAAAETNSVRMSGRIVNKYIRKTDNDDPVFIELTLACRSRSGEVDYPKIFWFDKDAINEIDAAYAVHDRVAVSGVIQTSKQHKSPMISGKTISHVEGRYSKYGVDAPQAYPTDENEVFLRGTIVNIFCPDFSNNTNLALVTLKVEKDGHVSYPCVSCYKRQFENVKDLEKEQEVYLVSHLQTKKAETENGTQYHRSLVCHYVGILEPDNG